MRELGWPHDRVKVDGLVRLVHVGLEQARQEFNTGWLSCALGLLTLALFSILARLIGRNACKYDLVAGLFHGALFPALS